MISRSLKAEDSESSGGEDFLGHLCWTKVLPKSSFGSGDSH
jgi:hypothetical protein